MAGDEDVGFVFERFPFSSARQSRRRSLSPQNRSVPEITPTFTVPSLHVLYRFVGQPKLEVSGRAFVSVTRLCACGEIIP